MRFKAISAGVLSPEELTADFAGAQNLGKVRLGQSCFYFTKFSGTSYLPLDQAEHAWVRQEEVKAKLCCGVANFDQFFLMIKDRSGTVHKGEIRSKEVGKEALSLLSLRQPSIQIGYYPPLSSQ